MTEDFNNEALQYLLDELGPEKRAAFEAQLAHDPAARSALQSCSAALVRFACETAPAEAMPPATQRAALTTILATINAPPKGRFQILKQGRWLWPLAASILLGLNLLQFFRPIRLTEERRDGEKATGHLVTVGPGAGEQTTPAVGNAPAGKTSKTDHSGSPLAGAAPSPVTDELRRLEKLRAEYANLERARAALGSEYEAIMRQLAQRALMGKGVGRLAAMELVDADSYARGERKGLVDIARGLLTEPGIVAVEPTTSPPAPPTDPNPVTPPPVSPVPDGTASTVNPNLIHPNAPPPENPPSPLAEPAQPMASTNNVQPYAWSVFDETMERGHLNLYNLPATPPDQSLQLWVKQVNSADYQRVGEVPVQFYGGSGSLSYNLPGATQPPAEILITQEPRNAPPTQPTGPTVLHGP